LAFITTIVLYISNFEMKRFFYFCTLFIIFTSAIYLLMWHGFYKYQYSQFKKREDCFNGNRKFDILFLGSSRINCSINPKIIDKTTHLSSYNLGTDGAHMYEFYLNLMAYLEKKQPAKIVVVGLDIFSLSGEVKISDPILYFSTTKNPVINQALTSFGYYKKIYDYIPYLKLTSFDDNQRLECFKGWFGISNSTYFYNGWIQPKKSRNKEKNIPPNFFGKLIFNRKQIFYLQKIIEICEKKKITLFLTTPPSANNYNLGYSNSEVFDDKISQITNSTNVKIIKLKNAYRPDDFQYDDNLHLNLNGSNKFSREIGNLIKDNLSQNEMSNQ
jgi:hypothetical protein